MHVDCTDNLSNKGGGGRSILVTCLQLAAVPLDFARFRVSLSLSLSLSLFLFSVAEYETTTTE
jgi:hypothetical protein